MTLLNAAILVLYALGMAFGQVLFKLAANRTSQETEVGFLRALLCNGFFMAAILVYGGLTILWVWILMRVPLSRAYPFVVLAFVFTPAIGFLMFGERVTLGYVVGLTFVIVGLGILVMKAG